MNEELEDLQDDIEKEIDAIPDAEVTKKYHIKTRGWYSKFKTIDVRGKRGSELKEMVLELRQNVRWLIGVRIPKLHYVIDLYREKVRCLKIQLYHAQKIKTPKIVVRKNVIRRAKAYNKEQFKILAQARYLNKPFSRRVDNLFELLSRVAVVIRKDKVDLNVFIVLMNAYNLDQIKTSDYKSYPMMGKALFVKTLNQLTEAGMLKREYTGNHNLYCYFITEEGNRAVEYFTNRVAKTRIERI